METADDSLVRRRRRQDLPSAFCLFAFLLKAPLIAKIDRLAGNVHFISGLMEAKVVFLAADLQRSTVLSLLRFVPIGGLLLARIVSRIEIVDSTRTNELYLDEMIASSAPVTT